MDTAAFFKQIRSTPFAGKMSQSQVDGVNTILNAWDKRAPGALPQFIAYSLATAFWETARTMQPIKEKGGAAYFTKMYDIKGKNPALAKSLGNIHPGDGALFCGRGYPMTTGRSNYEKASKLVGQDCVAKPDLMLQPDIASWVMIDAMTTGWFTGKKLGEFFCVPGKPDDWVNAREIINGHDHAALIGGYALHFYNAWNEAA